MSARYLVVLLLFVLPALAPAGTIAIVGGRVHTLGAQGVIERGVVLIRDERIVAVGTDVAIPEGAQVVDAAGRWVTPGIFNAFTQLGLVEVEGVPSTIDIEAANAPFAAGFDVQQSVNDQSTLIPIARLRGVTRSAIFPVATRSIFGGLGALIHLDPERSMVFKPQAAELIELGAQGARIAGGGRGTALLTLQDAFASARKTSSANPDHAAIQSMLSGQVPLLVHVERAGDIRNVLALRNRYPKLRTILVGANEGWRVADEIAKAGVPVIIDSFSNLPADFEMLAATQENAARLARAGVSIAIAPVYRFHAAMPHNAGLVTQYAGNAVANGLPWAKALEAITINPARMFGVADRLGSLEVGKIADVVIWSGDPLELDGRPEAVLIAGQQLPMTSRQTKLRDRYRQLSGPMPFSYR